MELKTWRCHQVALKVLLEITGISVILLLPDWVHWNQGSQRVSFCKQKEGFFFQFLCIKRGWQYYCNWVPLSDLQQHKIESVLEPGHSSAQLLLRLNRPVQIYFMVFIGCVLSYNLTFDSITKYFFEWKGESEFLSITTLFFLLYLSMSPTDSSGSKNWCAFVLWWKVLKSTGKSVTIC